MGALRYFWNVNWNRNLVPMLAVFAIAGATPGHAASTGFLSQTLDTCLILPDDRQQFEKNLTKVGWENVPNSELSTSELTGSIAIQISANLRYGNPPKAEWEFVWELANKNTAGLKKLKPMPENVGTRQFFSSSNGSFLQIMFRRNPWATEISCDMALHTDDIASTLAAIKKSSGQELSTFPSFTPFGEQKIENDQVTTSRYLVLINSEKVAGLTDHPMDFAIIANTYLSSTPPSR